MACEYCKNGESLFNVVTMDLVAEVGNIKSFIDGNFIKITTKNSGYILTSINYCPICGQELNFKLGE